MAHGRRHVGVVIGGGLFLLVGGLVARRPAADELPAWGPRPLHLGMPPDALALEDVLRGSTTPEARILWEDGPAERDNGWAVFVPSRLSRPCIGALDLEGILEHSGISLRCGWLAGRPLAAWTDTELSEYCRRYNVGWVVCSSQEARQRFNSWPLAVALPLPPEAEGWHVFALRRPFSFVLKGSAKVYEADARRVTLADVSPEEGEVVLSVHFQAGWHVRPGWIRIERDDYAHDSISLVRLRLPGPVGRVTLTWANP